MSRWSGQEAGALTEDFPQALSAIEEERPRGIKVRPLADRPWVPVLILIGLPLLVHFPQAVLGLSTNPTWLFSGITEGVRPGPIAGVPYLDPNAGFTTQALGTLAARDWLKGRVPWWNPYSGIGLPLAGGMTPAALFLPFLLLLLLPGGVLWLKLSTMTLAGLATYALLRELGLGRLASTMGGALYELNGTFAWMPGGFLTAPMAFLPLFLLGIEHARRGDRRQAGVALVAVAVAGSILAGMPEIAYLDGLLALAWWLYRWIGEQRRPLFAARVLGGGLLGLLLSAPLLIAFADYLKVSDTFSSHQDGLHHLAGITAAGLSLPYAFGPLHAAPGNAPISLFWNRVGGYAGTLLLLWAMTGGLGRRERGLRWLLWAWVLVAWMRSYGVQPLVGLLNHFPLLLETAFHRYAPPSWEMALAILAAFAVEDLKEWRGPFPRLPFVAASLLAGLSALAAAPWWPSWGWNGDPPSAALRWFFYSLLWSLGGLGVTAWAWRALAREWRRLAVAAIAVADAAALLVLPTLSGVRPGRLDTALLRYLRDHAGLGRFYTLDPIQPNYGAYYGTACINHNGLPMAADWERYVIRALFPPLKDSRGGAVFWPAYVRYPAGAGREYLLRFLSDYEELGVRYAVTRPDQELVPASPGPARGSTETALPRADRAWRSATPAEDSGAAADGLGSDASGIRMVYADTVARIWELPHSAPYFSVLGGGHFALSDIERECVRVKCESPAVLIRRELLLPGWSATVDGRPVPLVRIARVFQAIRLPTGEHVVRFHFEPPYVEYGWLACLLGFLGIGLSLLMNLVHAHGDYGSQ